MITQCNASIHGPLLDAALFPPLSLTLNGPIFQQNYGIFFSSGYYSVFVFVVLQYYNTKLYKSLYKYIRSTKCHFKNKMHIMLT